MRGPRISAAARRDASVAACGARLRFAVAVFVIVSIFAAWGSYQLSAANKKGGADPKDETSSANLLRRAPGLRPVLPNSHRALAGEAAPPTVLEEVKLTGAPPLLSWGDRSPNGEPVFDQRGAPIATSFRVVDPDVSSAAGDIVGPKGRAHDNLYRYTIKSEDAIKDIFIATLSSPGHKRKGDTRVSCKASPVTARWWCKASVLAQHARLGKPAPPLFVLDAGSTSAGYYGLLAASHEIPSLLVDPQPHCSYWTAISAKESKFEDKLHLVTALPDGPRADGSAVPPTPVQVRLRSGCLGTSAIDWPPTLQETTASYAGPREGGTLLPVPRRTLDELVDDPSNGIPGDGMIMIAKIDASGREDDVLRGFARTLASKRVLSVIVEINKQQLARRFGVGTAPDGSTVGPPSPTAEYDPAPAPRVRVDISDAENELLSAHIAAVARTMLGLGYEMLTADRGWWAAQDPCNSATDAKDPSFIDNWANKVMRHGEMDLWFYLPDITAA